ncbi:hypothetical protein BT63DRAFT_429975 [Microthyrium microscopicum]|uniref:SAP domain-containing protein n=1 Tax=Microthyrium microscopicum TaxID=703497 RepID=A0A6A6TXX2_9PEZI|nr:hypothetical protein BT63DRAFT_429975 [Microthyrium microscopicum]
MVDYMKMKNDELQALLKQRGLSHTGKKAEMVSRLQDDDNKTESAPAATTTTTTAKEDEIDWDDEGASKPAASESAQPASNPAPSQPAPAAAEPAAPATSIPAEGDKPADGAEAAKPEEVKEPVDFSMGLEAATIDEELEKRKARALKFGVVENPDPIADEAQKRLERAKKFGEEAPRGLNEALPDRRPKRPAEGDDNLPNFKRRGRGGRPYMRRGHGRRQNTKAPAAENSSSGGWTESDKKAAEARKARFGA